MGGHGRHGAEHFTCMGVGGVGEAFAAQHAGNFTDPLLALHPAQQALQASAYPAGIAYESLLREAMPDEELDAIRLYLRQQRAWGRDDFRAMVEAKTRQFASTRPAHRPRRAREFGK